MFMNLNIKYLSHITEMKLISKDEMKILFIWTFDIVMFEKFLINPKA